MKKVFILLLVVVIVIIAPLVLWISNYREQVGEINRFNLEYEKYKEKIVLGTEVASLINNAVDNNEKYEIIKNEEGIYQDDDKYCMRVEVVINSVTNEEQTITHSMESIYSLGIDRFVKNFNLLEFKCIDITYNSLGRVNKIVFELQ